MKSSVLEKIISKRAQSLKNHFTRKRISFLERKIASSEKPRPFYKALSSSDTWRIIAEIKARSPSKGVFLSKPDPAYWAKLYERCGASAISVVTEENFFNGSIGWLPKVKRASTLPVLRKDFLTTPEDILESRAFGADAVLLIAAILHPRTLEKLVDEVFSFQMEPVVEIHTLPDARKAMDTRARVVGINNRNLRDFSVSIQTTRRLLPFVHDRLIISESGIAQRKDIVELHKMGVKAFLVGESFLSSKDPESMILSLVEKRSGKP